MNIFSKKRPKFIGLIFVFVALILFIVGMGINISKSQLKKICTETVVSEVIENIKVHSSKKTKNGTHRTSTTYKPVFRFEYNGKSYTVNKNSSSNPPLFDVGEKTELKINPSNPEEFYVPADKVGNLAGYILLAMALIFLIVGIIVFILI